MNPSDAHSSLVALRQLKEMLDAGTITPAEFEALKRQIVFGVEPALPIAPPAAAAEPAGPAPAFEPASPLAPPAPPTPYAAPEPEPAPTTEPLPPVAPPADVDTDWLAAAAPSLLHGSAESAVPEEERRNPLNLIFAIGGLLVFLGVIAYLMIGRSAAPNEHLTSTSQTAADSTATVPEVGPQAEQLNLPPAAAPETIRVAPVTPPVSNRAAGQFRTDSSTAPVAPPPAAKVSGAAPVVSPTPATSPADSATVK